MRKFAEIYAELIDQEDFNRLYLDWIESLSVKTVLEAACGVGRLAHKLSQKLAAVQAFDLDADMIEYARKHYQNDNLVFYTADMLHSDSYQPSHAVIACLDSINYLMKEEELETVFRYIYSSLNPEGYFLFDIHHQNLSELYEEAYIEEAQAEFGSYQWSITAVNEEIIQHHFNFYGQRESHTVHQRIYPLETIISILENCGFKVKIKEDLMYPYPEEKIFIEAQKEVL